MRKNLNRNYVQNITMDIYSLIFYQILKYDPSSTFLTGDMIHDLVFGVLIPSIPVILILKFFSSYITGEHKDLQILAMIGGLAFIIFGGWFPIIAQLYLPLFGVAIFFAAINVFTRHVINEEGQKALKDFTLDMMSRGVKKMMAKMKPEQSEVFLKYYTVCKNLTKKRIKERKYERLAEMAARQGDDPGRKLFLERAVLAREEIDDLEVDKLELERELMRVFGKHKGKKIIEKVEREMEKFEERYDKIEKEAINKMKKEEEKKGTLTEKEIEEEENKDEFDPAIV